MLNKLDALKRGFLLSQAIAFHKKYVRQVKIVAQQVFRVIAHIISSAVILEKVECQTTSVEVFVSVAVVSLYSVLLLLCAL